MEAYSFYFAILSLIFILTSVQRIEIIPFLPVDIFIDKSLQKPLPVSQHLTREIHRAPFQNELSEVT